MAILTILTTEEFVTRGSVGAVEGVQAGIPEKFEVTHAKWFLSYPFHVPFLLHHHSYTHPRILTLALTLTLTLALTLALTHTYST